METTERFLAIALYQGVTKGTIATGLRPNAEEVLTALPSVLLTARTQDPTVICCAFKRQRFYLFSKREPVDTDDASAGRDVFNERPNVELAAAPAPSAAALASAAVLHTTKGTNPSPFPSRSVAPP